MLEIDGLTRRFGAKTAVDAVSLAIPTGQMVGVIGRSGAGKSTLLRMINRLGDPSGGRIRFDGADVTALKGKALISIAAGWRVEMLKKAVGDGVRLLRAMPNTPLLVGDGMTAFSREHTLTESEAAFAEGLFRALGRQLWVEEYQMDAVTALSGSSPAFVYIFTEAMADAGVACGLSRVQAVEMAAQTLLGSAKMVLETGMHPGALKDMVCSPAGTTIAGVRALEAHNFRSVVMEAVIAANDRSAALNS